MEHILGFGGVRLTDGVYDEDFDSGYGKVTYTPVSIQAENVNYKLVSRLLGFRVKIEITLYNKSDSDYTKFQNLFNMLNKSISSTEQKEITIYPKYSTSNTENLSFSSILDSDIQIKDIANVKVGQTFELKFIVPDLKQLSTTTGVKNTAVWVDESGNQMVDESGNSLVLKSD